MSINSKKRTVSNIDKYNKIISTIYVSHVKQNNAVCLDPKVALLGGADFWLPQSELIASNNEIFRGQGFDYLPGSKQEVEQISTLLNNRFWKNSIYVDKLATEQNFKSLSGSSPEIIHISTHGFYFTKQKKNENSINKIKSSQKPFKRSGLLQSESNYS